MKHLSLVTLLLFSLLVHAGEPLSHLTNIFRAPIDTPVYSGAGLGDFYGIKYPTFISATANHLYFVQAGSNQVFRYSPATESIHIYNGISKHLQGNISCITARADLGFFVCDQSGARVLLFDSDGRLVLEFSSFGNLASPIGVVESPLSNNVLVADTLFDHIVTFSSSGMPIRATGNRGTAADSFLQIQDITSDNDTFVVLDRLNKYVKQFDFDGNLITTTSRPEVTMPAAITVDHYGRIYIADEFDDTIRVYHQGRLVSTIGATGGGNAQFRTITDLSAHGNYLYVSDSNNNRIQVFVINPPEATP